MELIRNIIAKLLFFHARLLYLTLCTHSCLFVCVLQIIHNNWAYPVDGDFYFSVGVPSNYRRSWGTEPKEIELRKLQLFSNARNLMHLKFEIWNLLTRLWRWECYHTMGARWLHVFGTYKYSTIHNFLTYCVRPSLSHFFNTLTVYVSYFCRLQKRTGPIFYQLGFSS